METGVSEKIYRRAAVVSKMVVFTVYTVFFLGMKYASPFAGSKIDQFVEKLNEHILMV
jgi:hypothetical protein